MQPIRKSSSVGAAFVRTRVGPALRRRLAHVEPVDRALSGRADRRRRVERLALMYERLRQVYRPAVAESPGLPGPADIEAVEHAALQANHIYAGFFRILGHAGEFDRAATATTRRLIADRDIGRARITAQVMQRYDELRPIGDICSALCAFHEPMPDTAWTLFSGNDLALIMCLAAEEYFQLGFQLEPQTAAESLEQVLSGKVPLEADPDVWLGIAYASFSAGYLELSERTLRRAEDALPHVSEPERIRRLTARITNLRNWHERAARIAEPVDLPAGEIPFALVDYKHPDWQRISHHLSDPTETLAVLGHLTRREGVKFSGSLGLSALADQLREDVPPERRAPGTSATIRLHTVDRDVSAYAEVPDGTWTIVSDWFAHPLAGTRWDMPLNPKLRPIFISFYTDVASLKAPGAIEYLRRYAPIGCLDWDTVFLLQAAGVPAFFSGAISATVDLLIPPAAKTASPGGTLFLDTAPDGPGEVGSLRTFAVRDRRLLGNLAAAADRLRGYRDSDARVVTSDLRCYAAARALGCTAELRPRSRGGDDPATADLRGIAYLKGVADLQRMPDGDFSEMQRGISEKISAVLDAVCDGRSEDEVYQVWRDVCAPDVAQAESLRGSVHDELSLSFDLNAVCDAIRAASVTVERSEPGLDGPEINVEFSLDANYKHQLDIVLDSIVTRSRRPVRAFVLCREHGSADYERMARLFPTVSFVWLPSDNVDYGTVVGMNRWVTPATMDRTVLPVLLPEIDRIIHFDLDALCLTDLAELFDVDLSDEAIAAAAEPQPSYVSGYELIRRSASRLRREGKPELARELIIRTHAEHRFDFDVFNAGIMLLDLQKMRADDFCGRYLPYVQRFGVNGQSVLNAYQGSDYVRIDGEWNRLMRLEVPGEPKIAHWAGPHKPWRPHQYVTGRELWREQEDRFAARVEPLGESMSATPG